MEYYPKDNRKKQPCVFCIDNWKTDFELAPRGFQTFYVVI